MEPKTALIQVKTSVQKNIPTGFTIEESLDVAKLEKQVKAAYVFVYVNTSKDVWSFRYFIISRKQFIKLTYAGHDWYDNGYKREKSISKKSPAGIKIEWLEGKDEKETDRPTAFHNPLQGISCENCWENIWKD